MRHLVLCMALAASPLVAQRIPEPHVPADNPMTADKVMLGKALFWDEQLSSNGTVACGTCHQPRAGGADPRALSSIHPGPDGLFGTPDDIRGSRGVVAGALGGDLDGSSVFGMREQVTTRLAPTVINSALFSRQLWDGAAGDSFIDPISGIVILDSDASLETQSAGPPVNTVEMAHTGEDWVSISYRIAAADPLALATDVPADLEAWIGDASYPDLFERAFGDRRVDPTTIGQAIASYERTLISDKSPFDLHIEGTRPLSPLEVDGLEVFISIRGRCRFCHALNDFFENFVATGVRPLFEDPGLAAVTGRPQDLGRFKAPFLANLGLRPAFFHDGSAASLEEVVDFYDRGGNGNVQNALLSTPLNLTEHERHALITFLRDSLTDPRVANEEPPFDRPTLFSERTNHGEAFGAGTRGTFRIVPELVALEPPVLGNPHYTVGLGSAAAGQPAVLLFDTAPGDGSYVFSGAPIWVGATSSLLFIDLGVLQGRLWGGGYASWSLPIPDLPQLDGVSIYLQGLIADYGAPMGVAATAGQRVEFFAPR